MNLKQLIFNLRLKSYKILPIKRNRIVFLSHLGKTYACNPRYLCEYIALNYPNKFDLVWIYDNVCSTPPSVPKGVRCIPFFSHKGLRAINSARFIISNTRISDAFFFEKRKGQVYIQTWHSSMRLKCIEADANLGEKYEAFARRDSNKIDVILSGGHFSSDIFKNSFWYTGQVLETGTPRIDWLKNMTQMSKQQIFAKAGLDINYKYILYAPTFRKNNNTESYNIDFARLCESLYKKFNCRWKVLFRLHPNLKGIIKPDAIAGNVIDMTEYDDIQELLAISDILITDYSSSMFDAAFCDKICILYAADLENYLNNERNLYFSISDLPFPLARTNDDLMEIIRQFETKDYHFKLTEFMKTIGSCENGTACESICKYILARI